MHSCKLLCNSPPLFFPKHQYFNSFSLGGPDSKGGCEEYWDTKLLQDLETEERSECSQPGPPWCKPLANCDMDNNKLYDATGLELQGPWQGNYWRNELYTDEEGFKDFGISPERLKGKLNELANGPWKPTREFDFSIIECSDPHMGPAKGTYTGTIRRYCFNNTLFEPQGSCQPAPCKQQAGGVDASGEALQGPWNPILHGDTNILFCASEFGNGPAFGFWSGIVERLCWAGELQPPTTSCVPYDCIPFDEEKGDERPDDIEYLTTAEEQLLDQDDANGINVRGPWPAATNGSYSTLSCKERATTETVRYVGEVKRLCKAGVLLQTDDACVRAPCDFAHEYNTGHQFEFLHDTENLELAGPWPAVKDGEFSVIRCDDKVNGPLLDWDYSGEVTRECIAGILQPVEGRCFANNCTVIEQGVPNIGGRDQGQIGVIKDTIGQKLHGPWPFTQHDVTASIDCAEENGAMDAFNRYSGIITRKCYGGRFLEVKGECVREILMTSLAARCVNWCLC